MVQETFYNYFDFGWWPYRILSKGQVYAMESKIEIFRMCFFLLAYFWGGLN